jgi:hypothetical protein
LERIIAWAGREEKNSDTELSIWGLKVQGSFWLFLLIGGFSLFVSLSVQKTSFFTLNREEKVPWEKNEFYYYHQFFFSNLIIKTNSIYLSILSTFKFIDEISW